MQSISYIYYLRKWILISTADVLREQIAGPAIRSKRVIMYVHQYHKSYLRGKRPTMRIQIRARIWKDIHRLGLENSLELERNPMLTWIYESIDDSAIENSVNLWLLYSMWLSKMKRAQIARIFFIQVFIQVYSFILQKLYIFWRYFIISKFKSW